MKITKNEINEWGEFVKRSEVERRQRVNKKIDSLITELESILEDNNMAFVIAYEDYSGADTLFDGNRIMVDGLMKQLEDEINSNEYDK